MPDYTTDIKDYAKNFLSYLEIDQDRCKNVYSDGVAEPNTKLLLHMDGTDGSTTFIDDSPSAHTVTAVGDAQLDTDFKKFGTAAGLFDGTGDYLTIPDSDDFFFDGDFTVDFWVRDMGTGSHGLFGQDVDASNFLRAAASFISGQEYNVIFNARDAGTDVIDLTWTSVTIPIGDGVFRHFAFVRSGNDFIFFLDGVIQDTKTDSSAMPNFAAIFTVAKTRFEVFTGRLDEFRVSKGIARWTANFTPPTAPYSPSLGTGFCTATGGQCAYSFPTCEDKPNYKKGIRTYQFQSKDSPVALRGQGILPYIAEDGVLPLTTEIDPQRSVTVDSRLEITMEDDNDPPPIDHDKGVGKFHPLRAGTFWRNFVKRNKNFKRRPLRLFEGKSNYLQSEFKRKFTGQIENIEILQGGLIRITASDNMKRFKDVKIPNPVSSTNVLTAAINNTITSIPVTDASEYKLHRQMLLVSHSNTPGVIDIFDRNNETISNFDNIDAIGGGFAASTALDIEWNPKDQFLWFMVPEIGPITRLYKKDIYDGTETQIGIMVAADLLFLTYDIKNDVLYASDNTNLYTVNQTTGVATLVAAYSGATTSLDGICYDHVQDKLLGIKNSDDSLYSINVSDAVTTLIGSTGLTITINACTFDRELNKVITRDDATGKKEIILIDPSTGSGEVTAIAGTHGTSKGFATFNIIEPFIKIIDSAVGNEYLQLVAIKTSTNDLIVIRSAKFGTTAIAHDISKKVLQVAPFLDKNDIGVALDVGTNAINVIREIILGWVGIPWAQFGLTQFETEKNDWFSGYPFRRILEQSVDADKLLKQLRLLTAGNIWQDEDQKMQFSTIHPLAPEETVTKITATANLIVGSGFFDLNIESQLTRILLHYDPVDIFGLKDHKNSEDAFDDFNGHILVIDADAEDVRNFNEEKTLEIFADWIFKANVAKTAASRYVRLFSDPPALYSFDLDRKDSAIKVGDIIEITSEDFVEDTGVDGTSKFLVLNKKEEQGGIVSLKCFQTEFLTTKNFARIAHAGTPDFLSASDLDKKHAFITNALGEMSDKSPGYFTF